MLCPEVVNKYSFQSNIRSIISNEFSNIRYIRFSPKNALLHRYSSGLTVILCCIDIKWFDSDSLLHRYSGGLTVILCCIDIQVV